MKEVKNQAQEREADLQAEINSLKKIIKDLQDRLGENMYIVSCGLGSLTRETLMSLNHILCFAVAYAAILYLVVDRNIATLDYNICLSVCLQGYIPTVLLYLHCLKIVWIHPNLTVNWVQSTRICSLLLTTIRPVSIHINYSPVWPTRPVVWGLKTAKGVDSILSHFLNFLAVGNP